MYKRGERGPDRRKGSAEPETMQAGSKADAAAPPEDAAWGPAARERRQRARRRERNLAQTMPDKTPASVDLVPTAKDGLSIDAGFEQHEKRVRDLQGALARRRRRRMVMLALRLMFFVILPTATVAYYYIAMATDMYQTNAEFVIQKADSPAASNAGLGGLFSGFGLADAKDSIAVQGFLASRAAMERLDREEGFVAHFQNPAIDPLQRLDADASREDAYRLFQRHVVVGFDLTEGILRMEVMAADPESAQRFSTALISYAEEMVDSLSVRARRQNMEGAETSFSDREAQVAEAAARVLDLQQRYDTFSAEGELQIELSVIQSLELELEQLRRERRLLSTNDKPNAARLKVLDQKIAFTEAAVAARRSELTTTDQGTLSLAAISSALSMARSDLAAKEQMRIVALNTLEQARIEAARQVRYLSVNVPPVAPDIATYPRPAQHIAVGFFVFLGLYIMLGLTASILREQVSV
ncbi:MAG: capsule biosynthesis protein [Pseudomonadota bacterium]